MELVLLKSLLFIIVVKFHVEHSSHIENLMHAWCWSRARHWPAVTTHELGCRRPCSRGRHWPSIASQVAGAAAQEPDGRRSQGDATRVRV
jgi:hypothetical protein